uniref:Uncharacterized protein n=1 Tax=Salix viminalis TaxID=40686 RepID=A0A6N2M2J5_SALVM
MCFIEFCKPLAEGTCLTAEDLSKKDLIKLKINFHFRCFSSFLTLHNCLLEREFEKPHFSLVTFSVRIKRVKPQFFLTLRHVSSRTIFVQTGQQIS